MLPYFSVFDYIAFKVDGYNVTLLGQVVRPTLKSDAENSVKHIEGVEKVDNQIEALPPSPMDDRLRLTLYRAIYGYPAFEKYALGVQKPIRIIVNRKGEAPDRFPGCRHKVNSLWPNPRLLIAFHSPYSPLETGLHVCLPEKGQDSDRLRC
jgi:hypothetical protein